MCYGINSNSINKATINDTKNPKKWMVIGISNAVWKSSQRKILALPEQFSPKHLQAIIEGKLKDGDEVLVECKQDSIYNITNYSVKTYLNIIKLFPIKKEVNIEELARLYAKLPKDFDYVDEYYYQQYKIQLYEAFIAGANYPYKVKE